MHVLLNCHVLFGQQSVWVHIRVKQPKKGIKTNSMILRGMQQRRKRQIRAECIGAPSHSSDEENFSEKGEEEKQEDRVQTMLLSRLNDVVERGLGEEMLPDSLWIEWLWQSAPMQECSMDLMMNRMHLLGLLVARYRATRQRNSNTTLAHILQQQGQKGGNHNNRLWLFDGPVSRYTLRQLTDSLQNLQIQWNRWALFSVPKMQDAIDALLHRFGVLASGSGSSSMLNSPYDDPGSIEKCSGDESKVVLTRICIRRLVGTFLVLYRHMHCWEAKEVVEEDCEDTDCGVKMHHILAASDDFSRLSMQWDLMPGAMLNYVHDFRGLFNCVSQVLPISQ